MEGVMEHILIVEDELNLAEGLRCNLEAEGYQVTICGDGASALTFLETTRVDLVVLDLMLPGMSGYAVCETLRAREQVMPILILSARSLAEDRTRGFQVGADQYMQKPFDLDEFLIRVRSLLAMYQRRLETSKHTSVGSPSVVTMADGTIEVDPEHLEVRRNGQPTRVTPLEMKLLRYFLDREGTIISRRELLEQVWGMPGHINTRAPDQFIRRLRRIIERNPSEPEHLITLRDVGYQFIAEVPAK
ncbi:MAG: response regulator transcription factor [Planctomycetia bacterium]|nr:response regulator transcription factor [Planctomycetia bacterium]